MASCSLQRSFSSFSINLIPMPRLTTLSSDIFMFDHTTSAFRPNGPWSGIDMLIMNLLFKARGFRQTTKAPPRLISLSWTSSFRPDFSMTACQEIVIRGCRRFSSQEIFFDRESPIFDCSEVNRFFKYMPTNQTKINPTNMAPPMPMLFTTRLSSISWL